MISGHLVMDEDAAVVAVTFDTEVLDEDATRTLPAAPVVLTPDFDAGVFGFFMLEHEGQIQCAP